MVNSTKMLLFILITVFLLGSLGAGVIIWLPISFDQLNPVQRILVDRISKKVDQKLQDLPENEQMLISYDQFFSYLNPVERQFARRILAIDPKELGFNGSFFTLDPVPDLVEIPAQQMNLPDRVIDTGVNHLPRPVYQDFLRLNATMQQDIGKNLFINSGYRSPGFQAYLFFFYLVDENHYSLRENAKWLAMPGYSEHNSANTAIDFINQDGISGEEKGQTAEDFEQLPEFGWLQQNAQRFNFQLSYPKDNPAGVSYEPWHWHWQKLTN